MYPGTEINNWFDLTVENDQEINEVDNHALFLTASAFAKGPEEMIKVSGGNFYALFGSEEENTFSKYGQPAIQAANIINAGGQLLVKRIVADDANLANVVILAQLKTEVTQTPITAESDEEEGEGSAEVETTETNTLKFSSVYIENCRSFEQFKTAVTQLYDATNKIFPIIAIADNGRGVSSKAVRFNRNQEISISIGKEFYNVSVYEGTNRIESLSATVDSVVYNKRQYGLDDKSSTQVKFYIDENILSLYKEAIAEKLNMTAEEVSNVDFLNLCTIRGIALDGITIDPEGLDIDTEYGVPLRGGTNGAFGNAPVNTPAWEAKLNDFFNGVTDPAIYDCDENPIGAVVDANYPYSVKETIAKFVNFRQDTMFFRDTRLDVSSYGTLVEAMNRFQTNNKFISDYFTTYEINDPSTMKRIRVTMMYDFAACLVNEFDTGIHYPQAGYANGFILKNAIEGTINYTPRKLPNMNQKQMIEDLRVNYAIFNQDMCLVQTLYTSQKFRSQLSYANNVLSIEEIIRAIRLAFPRRRYTFIDHQDFTLYQDLVNNLLKSYRPYFDKLEFVYQKDPVMSHNKIFYGALRFAFKDWAQTELFDVYAIPADDSEDEEY